MHLTSEELVDIAEGTRSEASAPHLAGCDPCRAQLSDLRAMMSVAADVDVPEPSPLFWDHLSSRVSAAIAAEVPGTQLAPSRELFRTLFGSRTLQVAVALAGSLLIVVLINGRRTVPAVVEAPGLDDRGCRGRPARRCRGRRRLVDAGGESHRRPGSGNGPGGRVGASWKRRACRDAHERWRIARAPAAAEGRAHEARCIKWRSSVSR